ncbi:NADPH-dependent FMN reductase [Priestia flexa]|uniref:NADPH-dependent FMN reductase n=1 Tax=Priestia flexa TaxID=86664 RepID=UPI001B32EA81|nr:NAD(P)H-dependent oxidoreductase [Priestia flexa]
MATTIGIICGSLREQSYNRIIAQSLIQMNKSVQFRWIEIKELPFFNEDLEVNGDPDAVLLFKSAVEEVDGIIIVSPEYNSGIPGVLKNALDWSSRPPKTSPMNKKPIGLIGATPGGFGTAFAQMQLRQVLETMQAQVFPFQKLFISQVHQKINLQEQVLSDEKTKKYLQSYVEEFLDWIQ